MSSDLPTLLATMRPVLNPGRFAFVTVASDQLIDLNSVIASVREEEGLSVILAEQDAIGLELKASYIAAWITLTVQSDLAAIGLTAAFSNALAQAGLSCNVVAGNHHDHIFVPHEQAQVAMAVLQKTTSKGRCLTIRSSRDRFAARLMRYRVAQRQPAQRPGLTQVLAA